MFYIKSLVEMVTNNPQSQPNQQNTASLSPLRRQQLANRKIKDYSDADRKAYEADRRNGIQ